MEAYSRVRAFFMTLAFVMIRDQTFFSFEDELFIENKIFSLVQMTVDRRHPPLSFCTAAWGSVLQHFADEFRTNQRKMASVVRDTPVWTHYWTAWKPASQSEKSGLSSGCTLTPKDAVLQRKVDRLKALTTRLETVPPTMCTVHAKPHRNTTTMSVSSHQNFHQDVEKVSRSSSSGEATRSCGLHHPMSLSLYLWQFRQVLRTLWMHGPAWVNSLSVYPLINTSRWCNRFLRQSFSLACQMKNGFDLRDGGTHSLFDSLDYIRRKCKNSCTSELILLNSFVHFKATFFCVTAHFLVAMMKF